MKTSRPTCLLTLGIESATRATQAAQNSSPLKMSSDSMEPIKALSPRTSTKSHPRICGISYITRASTRRARALQESANQNLEIFQGELIDPEQSLFVQTTLFEFTPFGCLPVELRRMIWNEALPPGRLVRLDRYSYCDNAICDECTHDNDE